MNETDKLRNTEIKKETVDDNEHENYGKNEDITPNWGKKLSETNS